MNAIKIILFLLVGVGLGAVLTWVFQYDFMMGYTIPHHMMPFGWFGGGFLIIGGLLFLGLMWYILSQINTSRDSAMSILNERLAQGDITVEEYKEKKEHIRNRRDHA